MAEEQEQQKTEEVTQRRLEEARKQGKVAFSQEVNTFVLLLFFTIFISLFLPNTLRYATAALSHYIADFHLIKVGEGKEITGILHEAMANFATIGAIPLFIVVVAGVFANFIQNGFLFVPTALRFDYSRISPLTRLQNLFSSASVAGLISIIIKLGCVCMALYLAISSDLNALFNIKQMSIADSLTLLLVCLRKLLIVMVLVSAIIGAFDYIYQRNTYMQSLMMSKHELQAELRQAEGNPEVKSRLRAMQAEHSRNRMINVVPMANAVLTDFNGYAVALQYEQGQMYAPKVVAKGIDTLALKIIEVATEHLVPVIVDEELAVMLYRTVKVGQAIRQEQYEPVAKAIIKVLKAKRKV